MTERILLIGSGGREHALARALRASASCETLWCAPGNPGIASEARLVALQITSHDDVARWCTDNGITLVVIGPEQPLADGLADSLRGAGLDVFGPSRSAAQLESSKGFSKDFMQRHGIPTAPYRRFAAYEAAAAEEYVLVQPLPVVIKYDGLAAGKGVVVAETHDEALATLRMMFDGAFGSDGVVVEGFLVGEEASLFAITDGTRYVVLAPAQDHKRIGEGDTGKNTGGMGAYAPAPLVTPAVQEWAERHIIAPTIEGMAAEGNPFVGCLYVGLMVQADGTSNVVEYNARFGDPETQAVMSVLRADVAALFASAARGTIDASTIGNTAQGYACNIVLASGGYPDSYGKGFPITGLDAASSIEGVYVYHAGTAESAEGIVTAGGRVLGVTAHAATLADAVERAYRACDQVTFTNKTLRRDIAKRAL